MKVGGFHCRSARCGEKEISCPYLELNRHSAVLQPIPLARSQYSEGPATDHLDTGFSLFPCVYKQMLRWLLCFQVATTCFSCSPPDLKLNVSVTSFIFLLHVKCHCHRVTAQLQFIIIIIDVYCHRSFLPGTSLEPAMNPTAQASSFTLFHTAVLSVLCVMFQA
jgi:hypothetical protein